MPFLNGESPTHSWLREDGYQLVWTSRLRLLERINQSCMWINLKSPCTYEHALIYALANGFKWVRNLPEGTKEDKRCRVRLCRKREGERLILDYTSDKESLWEKTRHNALAPYISDLRKQPIMLRVQREFRVRLHGVRVKIEEAGVV